MIKRLCLFVIFATIFGSCGQNVSTPGNLGKKLKFSKNIPLDFGDFKLTFIEKRTVISEMPVGVPSRSFDYFDFTVSGESVEKVVSWSSGTGDIGPSRFEINGQKYELELRMSDKLGRLADDEIVVWKK